MTHLKLVSDNTLATNVSEVLTSEEVLLLMVRFNGWSLVAVGKFLGIEPMKVRSREGKAMHTLRKNGWTNDEITSFFVEAH